MLWYRPTDIENCRHQMTLGQPPSLTSTRRHQMADCTDILTGTTVLRVPGVHICGARVYVFRNSKIHIVFSTH
jgi:hypothetical protein